MYRWLDSLISAISCRNLLTRSLTGSNISNNHGGRTARAAALLRASSQTPLHRSATGWELPDALFEVSQARCNFVHCAPAPNSRFKRTVISDGNSGSVASRKI